MRKLPKDFTVGLGKFTPSHKQQQAVVNNGTAAAAASNPPPTILNLPGSSSQMPSINGSNGTNGKAPTQDLDTINL